MTDPHSTPSVQPAPAARSSLRPLPLLTPLAWLATLSAAAALLFAHLWPPDLTTTSRPYILVSHAAFLILVFQFHAGLALMPVAFFAALARRRRLLIATLPLLLITLAPAAWSYRPRPAPALPPSADTLTLFSANLMYSRADLDALKREIDDADPDLILFQEYSTRDRDRLAPILSPRYPHRAAVERDDAFGQAVYSRRPFLEPPRNYPPGHIWTEPQISVTIALDARPVTITNIHLLPPVSLGSINTQRLQAAALANLADQHISRGGSLILAGDFNATPGSHHLRALERTGLRETHALAGRGRAATWPRTGVLRLAPGIRIDNILISPDLLCLEARTGRDVASDHRPVIATVTRRPASTRN